MYGNHSFHLLEHVTNVRLTAYNGATIHCLVKIDMFCSYKDKKWMKATFYVVDVPGPAVVGLPTSEQLHLVTIHVDSVTDADTHETKSTAQPVIHDINDLKRAYPQQFDTVGNFAGEAKLLLKDDAEAFIDAPRKCSIHMKDKLKQELQSIVSQGVIRKVDEHTDWCSSLAYSTKKDGSIRVCIDPQRLNAALRRCPHKIPTLEEINPELAKAKLFSKLDAKAGYWSVHLNEESQLLTTFRTPFGRFCWRRLPFGLNVSQDIFQARMDQILEGLKGVTGIGDDVCVYAENSEDHDRNLTNLMERAQEEGLVFNSAKCLIKQRSISFFGNTYTDNGITPDDDKVRDIQNMPTPENREDLHRFIGMMSYLSQFIPHFAEKAHTLRGLLKKDVPWLWDVDHQKSFDELKHAVSTSA